MSVSSQDLLEAIDGVALLIDHNLIVQRIGWRNWNSFWTMNGGAHTPADVVGRDLTDFFSEGQVRDSFRTLLLQLVQGKRHVIQTNYRCDSPALRRSMRLTITPVRGESEPGHLLYQSIEIAVEQRPALPLFAARAVGSNWPDALKICSICAKVQWPMGSKDPAAEWIEPPEYYRRGGSDVVLLSHGFCWPCYETFMAEES
jgi:hypothetical protein